MTAVAIPRRQTYLTRSPGFDEGHEASGFSEEALNLNEFITDTYKGLHSAYIWGRAQKSLESFLISSYNGVELRERTPMLLPMSARRARQFLELLPDWIPEPEIDIDDDGDISFEWYVAPDRIVNVSVGPTNIVHFAGITAKRSLYGTEEISDEIPNEIVDLIKANMVFTTTA